MDNQKPNPFLKESWSLTEQGLYLKERGLEAARAAARAAGLNPDEDFSLGLWEEGKQPPATRSTEPPKTGVNMAAFMERRLRESRPYLHVALSNWKKSESVE